MKTYHWTTKENAHSILKYGLRKGSFVCRDPRGWHGEICLVITGLTVDWNNRDAVISWQATTHKYVPPSKITTLANYREVIWNSIKIQEGILTIIEEALNKQVFVKLNVIDNDKR